MPDLNDPLRSAFPSSGPRVIGVVDANALLSSVDNECRTGWPSRLRRMAGHSVTLYASSHVFVEVYEKLPRFVRSKPGSPTLAQLRRCWEEEYLPLIRFVEIADGVELHPDIAAITDPDDRPTGVLAKLIGPCIVFSDDSDLRDPGYAPIDWRASAGVVVRIADNDSQLQGAAALTMAPPVAAHYLLKTVGRWLDATTPAMYLIGAATTALNLWDTDRRSKTVSRLGKIGEVFAAVLEPILESQEEALSQVREAVYRPTGLSSLKQQVASVLSRSRYLITTQDLRDRIDGALLHTGQPGVEEVSEVLHTGSEFIAILDGSDTLWQLGGVSRPWPRLYPLT